jgi:hypothetical protein
MNPEDNSQSNHEFSPEDSNLSFALDFASRGWPVGTSFSSNIVVSTRSRTQGLLD